MEKLEKLKSNGDFRRIYSRGNSFVCPCLVLYIMKGRGGRVRFGITAGKKIGCAVYRNRAKRIITAAFRECLPNIAPGYDFVIVARTKILKYKSTQVSQVIKDRLISAGVWCEL